MSLAKLGRRLVLFSTTAPRAALFIAVLAGALATWRASKLELRPQLWTLLAPDQPSVVELHRTLARVRGLSNVFVVLEGDDNAELRRFGDALVPRLLALGSPWVGSAETGVQDARAFLAPRAGLFASVPELEALRDELIETERGAFKELIGADLDDEPAPPTSFGPERLERLLGNKAEYATRYPDGYYQSADGRALVVVARSAVLSDDLPQAREAQRRIEAVVRALSASHPDVRVSYAGDLVTGLAEYSAIRGDLLEVGLLGVGLILAVALLFYRRVRALVLMGLTIGLGLAFTFGVSEVAIGSLNIATGFLFSIVAGGGINPGIILQSRYFEERRTRGPRTALTAAVSATHRPTLAAALAAAVAYLALATTSFSGFRQFAFIGCAGMLLSWVATYLVLPPLLLLSERLRPSDRKGRIGRWLGTSARFDRPFTYLVARVPRAVAALGLVSGLVALIVAILYVRGDPEEYNLRRMENDRTVTGNIYRASTIAAGIVGARTEGAMVVLADRLDQVAPLAAALRARRDAAPADAKPFEEVHSLLDFVPADQEAKLPLLRDLRRRLVRAHERGNIDEPSWQRIMPLLPPATLTAFTTADLPEAVRRPFTERDGSVGRVLFIEPTAGRSDTDLRYLLLWADSFRSTRLPTGEVIHGSGRAVIYADLVGAVHEGMPRALSLALALTLASLWLGFRHARDVWPVTASLLLGLSWMGAALAALDVRVHFINFVALPITLGIGVDYAINIMSRARDAGGGRAGVLAALAGSGGPVILCSLTTTLGYLALLRSRNAGVRSLGTIAVVGETACLLAAVLVLPAALAWWSGRKDPA